MVKIRYSSYRKLINEALKNRAEFIFEKMNGNTKYLKYQPTVTELGAQFAPFTTAITNFKLGGSDRRDIRDAIQRSIIATMDDLGRQLEADANAKGVSQEAGEVLIKNTGFDIIETRAPIAKKTLTYLAPPTNLHATDDKKHGSVTLEWDENVDAITFLILDKDTDGKWQIVGVSEEVSVVLSGFPSNAARTFCVIAISNGTLMSDKSEPVTVWIS